MQLTCRIAGLPLTHRWAISRSTQAGGMAASRVVFVELTDPITGIVGRGEAAPSARLGESCEGVVDTLTRWPAETLSFEHTRDGGAPPLRVAPGGRAAVAALEMALLDGAGRLAGRPVHDLLGLAFTEGRHITSFSIGIDSPEVTGAKARAAVAAGFPILKLKLGGVQDRENLAALREAAPSARIRVDANEAWKTPEEALDWIEWLAGDSAVEFVEQPMPAATPPVQQAWLKARSPLPLMADESCVEAGDVEMCANGFHAVNVKLMKIGGITGALRVLHAARHAGLKTMLGCMVESSLGITAAAHLADLADHLDLDGHLLLSEDPFEGLGVTAGILSLAGAPVADGLRVAPRGRS